MNNRRYKLLLAVLVSTAFYGVLGSGVMSFGDWFFPNQDRISGYWRWPSLFIEGQNLGAFRGVFMHRTPLNSLMNWFETVLHIDMSVTSVLLYFILPVVLAVVGMWLLVKRVSTSDRAAFWASLLYVFNTFFLLSLLGGQLYIAAACALIPFIVTSLDRALERTDFVWNPIVIALITTAQILYEPRIFLVSLPIYIVWVLGRSLHFKVSVVAVVKLVGFTAIYLILFNLYWLYGSFAFANASFIPQDYTDVAWLKTLSYATFSHALLLNHVWWPDFLGGDVQPPRWLLSVIPLMVVWFIIWGRERKSARWIWYLVVLLLGGIFLAKGVNVPLGGVNAWLFTHMLGFSLFRDPAKFFIIIAFCYSVLFGLAMQAAKARIKRPVVSVLFSVIIGLSLIISVRELWLDSRRGVLDKQPFAPEVAQFIANKEEQQGWFRIFWIPTYYRHAFLNPQTPSLWGGDASLVNDYRRRVAGFEPWISGLRGDFSLEYFMSALGVRYIAIPGDVTNEMYNTHFPFTQSYYVANTEERLHVEAEAVTDALGTTSYFVSNNAAKGQVYTTQNIIVSDNWMHEDEFKVLGDDPSVNLPVLAEDLTSNPDQVVAVAAKRIYHIPVTIDGIISDAPDLSFNIAKDGEYHLHAPYIRRAVYRLDGAAVVGDTVGDQIVIPAKLTSGSHSLTIVTNDVPIEEQVVLFEVVPVMDQAAAVGVDAQERNEWSYVIHLQNEDETNVVLSRAYHDKWQLRNASTGATVPIHFSNLFGQNVWHIPDHSGQDFVIEFTQARPILATHYISLLAVLLSFIALLIHRKRVKQGRG